MLAFFYLRKENKMDLQIREEVEIGTVNSFAQISSDILAEV